MGVYSIAPCAASNHSAIDQWDDLINEIAPQFGVPPNRVKAHLEFESAGDEHAVGTTGRGLGLMQIDFGTYQDTNGTWWYSSAHGKTDEIFDPRINIMIACRDFLAPAEREFPGHLNASIAAYNAGIEKVKAAIAIGAGPHSVTTNPKYVELVRTAFAWYCDHAPN